jgi:SNF2 family DNA or RNA helicase
MMMFERFIAGGGILANEMGTGKTATCLVFIKLAGDELVKANRAKEAARKAKQEARRKAGDDSEEKRVEKPMYFPTLVVMPPNVLGSWCDEHKNFFPGTDEDEDHRGLPIPKAAQ